MITLLLYLQCARQWPYYGATFFPAQLLVSQKASKKINYHEDKGKAINVRVGVNVEGIHIIDSKNVHVLSDELSSINICKDLRYPNSFMFETMKSVQLKGTLERKKRCQSHPCLFILSSGPTNNDICDVSPASTSGRCTCSEDYAQCPKKTFFY